MRLAAAAKAAGDDQKAGEALARVYFEFPQSRSAAEAATEYNAMPGVQRLAAGNQRYKLELGRAQRLAGARQWAQARTAFEQLRPFAAGDDRELVTLRLAEADYFQRRFRAADGLKPLLGTASRRGEALYYYAVAVRALGRHPEYLDLVRRIAAEFPTESWAEEALNNLATHYILVDDDDQADAVFREMYEKYPRGRYAERAAWKAGWRAFRTRRFAETIVLRASGGGFSEVRLPSRLDLLDRPRPRGARPAAPRRSAVFTGRTDYQNSYYGRLATSRTKERRLPPGSHRMKGRLPLRPRRTS